jgi:hypothetical protein
MEKSDENHSTASSAAEVKQTARKAHFGTMGTWTSKGRQERQANGLCLTIFVIHEHCYSAQNHFRLTLSQLHVMAAVCFV